MNTLQDELAYTRQQRNVLGPYPRLAPGTGRTAPTGTTEYTSLSPGYLTAPDYEIIPLAYNPPLNENRLKRIPRAIDNGYDARELTGTWRAHDFTPAERFFSQMRSAPNWQRQEYPIGYRNLLQYQLARKYVVRTRTKSAQPLARNDYSLGYTTTPDVASQIGMNALGYMGSP